MSNIIIYKDGVYNIYSSNWDKPIFKVGITKEELKAYMKREYGIRGMDDLPARLDRAHSTGSSEIGAATLEDSVALNRAGPKESRLPLDEFITKYLTLPSNEENQITKQENQMPEATNEEKEKIEFAIKYAEVVESLNKAIFQAGGIKKGFESMIEWNIQTLFYVMACNGIRFSYTKPKKKVTNKT